ncbi:diguanylate cyclase domain-containing protein [Pseudomonas luteola]
MLIAPLPANEEARLQLLRSLDLLDTPAEETFDRVTRVVSELLQVPIALVSLIDERRQWFKSAVGLEVCETPRDLAFCSHALHAEDMLLVEDALKDPRFADNPLVTGEPYVRFYAGVPLRSAEGLVLGTLCAIDTKPRVIQKRIQARLKDLALIVEKELLQREAAQAARLIQEQDRAALLYAEARFLAMFEHSPIGKTLVDLQGRFAEVNPRLCKILGYTVEELRQKTFSDVTYPGDLATDLNLVADLMFIRRQAYSLEKRYIHKDGRLIWVEIHVTLVRDASGNPLHFIAVVHEIGQRKEHEALQFNYQDELEKQVQQRTLELQSSRETLQTITDNLPILIAQVDKDLCYRFNNDVYRQVFNINPAKLLGKPLAAMLRPDLYAELLPCFERALAGERVTHDNIQYSLEQDRIWSATYIPDIRNGEVKGFYVMSQDVTERKRAEKVLVDKAMLDPLTGLPNRRALQDKLEQIVEASKITNVSFALFFLDLDGFKLANNTHGHEGGDEILKQVAIRLTHAVRKDDFVSRLAGDEFVIIAAGVTTASICSRIAKTVCDTINVPYVLSNGPARIGTSIGIALSATIENLSAETIMAQADAAMYEAKRRGRNNYQFASGLAELPNNVRPINLRKLDD